MLREVPVCLQVAMSPMSGPSSYSHVDVRLTVGLFWYEVMR